MSHIVKTLIAEPTNMLSGILFARRNQTALDKFSYRLAQTKRLMELKDAAAERA
ncbi:hypothetical protein [Oceanomicrobium pacificus]|uniref:Uncharacterized protein n=1 Tax=Oceanomicrobium pacificus TaxID=2692916 RepID=A0A6B0TLH0_9RHOB|nr:hypothetical protein [Oceanomicrobium pacificus]MXU64736.1 hypothetical protein [Oceanomicrobium pacificus]